MERWLSRWRRYLSPSGLDLDSTTVSINDNRKSGECVRNRCIVEDVKLESKPRLTRGAVNLQVSVCVELSCMVFVVDVVFSQSNCVVDFAPMPKSSPEISTLSERPYLVDES